MFNNIALKIIGCRLRTPGDGKGVGFRPLHRIGDGLGCLTQRDW